jgi:hypothetical protein
MLLAAFAARPPPLAAALLHRLDLALFELLLELLKRDDGDCVVPGVFVLERVVV